MFGHLANIPLKSGLIETSHVESLHHPIHKLHIFLYIQDFDLLRKKFALFEKNSKEVQESTGQRLSLQN